MEQSSTAVANQLKINYLPIDTLVPNPRNSRTHSEKQIKKLASIIKEFGFNEPVHISNGNVLICGHARVEAAKRIGLFDVPAIYLGHLSEAQQKAYLIAHNKIALEAGWDNSLLKEDLIELRDLGFDLELTAFDKEEIDKFIAVDDKMMGLSDPDAIPDLAANYEPVTKLGDIWLLGEHRLMCGDSTMVDNVLALLKNDVCRPNLMVTDPPYGVKYEPEWRDEANLGVGERSKGKVENDDRVDWTDAYSLFSGNVVYVWHAGKYSPEVAAHLKTCNFEIVSQIIWVKQHFALSRGDYHWQHEPCWYAVKKGQNHAWQGARDQSTTWEINNNNSFGNPNAEKTWGHGTQKPIDCMARPIINNSKVGEYVYDPFGGSGTTLIACEKLARKCLMMELSPAYCDVIIKRWEEFTGKKAVHEAMDLPFGEMNDGKRI